MFPNNFRFTSAKANFNYENRGQRREFLRVRLNDDGLIELFERQNSQVLSSICFSDGLVEVPVKKEIVKGDPVNFYSFQSSV
jgi:molybdopterin molybdotransferase